MERTVREGVWKEGRISVSLALTGTQAAQLMVVGLELRERTEVPRFTRDLIRIGSECLPLTQAAARRQIFVALTEGHRWTEFLELTPADLSAAGVDHVMIVDNATGVPIRILPGTPLSATLLPYDQVRSDTAVGGFGGAPLIADGLERLNLSDLSAEMRIVVTVAVDVYRRQLRRVVLFQDGGVRMALTFAVAAPPGAATLLLDLTALGGEVSRGLTEAALRSGLAWPEGE